MPALRELYDRYQDEGLAIVGVSLDDTAEIARRAAEEHEAVWPQICDGLKREGPLCRPFGINGIPDCLVFDKAGRLRARGLRGLSLFDLVEELLAEKSPADDR